MNNCDPAPWPNEHTVFRTYQLRIRLSQAVRLQIGRLGEFDFPAGRLRLHRIGKTQFRGTYRAAHAA
jgi:hypothetical protein